MTLPGRIAWGIVIFCLMIGAGVSGLYACTPDPGQDPIGTVAPEFEPTLAPTVEPASIPPEFSIDLAAFARYECGLAVHQIIDPINAAGLVPGIDIVLSENFYKPWVTPDGLAKFRVAAGC